MKTLLLLGLMIATLSGFRSAAADKPIKDSSEVIFELNRTKDVLFELEAAHNWHRRPEIRTAHISAVAELVARLDQQTLDQVDKSDRLVSRLLHAVRSHSDQSEDLSWWERCDGGCADKVVDQFMDERRTLVSFFEDYKNLTSSYANRLIDSLLEKAGADELSEHIIRMTFLEYESLMNSVSMIGQANESIGSYLSLIDMAAFYKNREQGRAIEAMLKTYDEMRDWPEFAHRFKENFLYMLHVNGYGVYNHGIIRVKSIRNVGKFV